MDLHWVEPEQVPLPPDQVRVVRAEATPYADGRRVKVGVSLTPFLERPDVELRIADPAGETLAEADVVECVEPEFELTLHLRHLPPKAMLCRLHVKVGYPDQGIESALAVDLPLPEPMA